MNNSPGSDFLPAEFYQFFWKITKFFFEILTTGQMTKVACLIHKFEDCFLLFPVFLHWRAVLQHFWFAILYFPNKAVANGVKQKAGFLNRFIEELLRLQDRYPLYR